MSWLIQKINSVLFYRTPIGEAFSMLHSLYLHLRFSFNDRAPGRDKERLRYYLVKHCHIVEKGLALPSPRLGFGQPKITGIINKAGEYERLYGQDEVTIMLRDMLRAYLNYHQQQQHVLPAEFEKLIKNFNAQSQAANTGGLKVLQKSQWSSYSLEKYSEFLTCRHSVRDFSDSSVDDGQVRDIIGASIKTPSVCNRQGWAVHYYRDKKKIKDLLSYQNGNAGFTDCIDKLIIVTGNSKAFTRHEHNQLFVDGGLLSMNIMLALHAAGLGSCPLNTCMPFHKETALKVAAGIPRHERVIMMIAIGNLKDEFAVAQSGKFKIDEVLRVH